MVFLWIFEEVDDLLNFSFALVETRDIIELDMYVLDDIKFFGLGSHLGCSSHRPLRRPDDRPKNKQDKDSVHNLIDTIERSLEATSSYIFILDISILGNVG